MGKRPYYKSNGLGGFFVVLIIGIIGLVGLFLSNYGFLLIPVFLVFYFYVKNSENKTQDNSHSIKEIKIETKKDFEWWNKLDDNWKKILNFNISKPNIIFTDSSINLKDIKSSELNNLINKQGITDRPNQNELTQIENLKELDLYLKKVTDLKPLKYLLKLKNLNVGFNEEVLNYKPISDLVNLEKLYLNYAFKNFSNINIFFKLKKLEELHINNNSIESISGINNLKNLRILDISSNQIKDLQPLVNLGNLSKLYLKHNPLKQSDVNELRNILKDCEIEFE